MSCIVPVEKRKIVTGMKDLRPAVLTSCVMKIFEKVVLPDLQAQVAAFMDPFQFAYQKKRSVDDATLYVLNNIYWHSDKPESPIRLMFYDFSSAFNTIQPHIPADKLMDYNMHGFHCSVGSGLPHKPSTICQTYWQCQIRCDLYEHGCTAGNRPIPTFLFSVYTADCRSCWDSMHIYSIDCIRTCISHCKFLVFFWDRKLSQSEHSSFEDRKV